ncbi:MAG TPA: DNA polymerase III subunit delta [bacterium]|nr:DNA polymerase III subunit delta [bacterium]
MLYFIFGSDNYRAKEKVKEIVKDKTGFELQKIEAEEISLDELSGKIKSASLFSPQRILIIENLSLNEAQKEITDYLKEQKKILDSPNDIFIFLESKVDKKTSLYKFLSAAKNKFELEILKGAELKKWLMDYVKKKNGQIENSAVAEIMMSEQKSLNFLSLELDKLLAYSSNINLEAVKLLTAISFDDNIFNLTDAVSANNKSLALKLLSQQLEAGTEPLYILTMLVRQIRLLIQIKEAGLKNNNYSEIAKELSLHPFVVQKVLGQTKNYSFEDLKIKFGQLLTIDLQLKSSKIPAEVLLTNFIVE